MYWGWQSGLTDIAAILTDVSARLVSLEITRRDGLGQLSAVHLDAIPAPPVQNIVNGTTPFISQMWAALLEVFPSGAAEIRAQDGAGLTGTFGLNTVVRAYEELEGKLDVFGQVSFEDQTAGTTNWSLFAVSGINLDAVGAITLATILAPGSSSNQNGRTNSTFKNLATILPFPGFDGSRRFIDLAFSISHNGLAPRNVQLLQTYGEAQVRATGV